MMLSKAPHTLLTPVFIGIILAMTGANALAADTTKKLRLFTDSNKAPPGFESLRASDPETTIVSVYYGKRLVLNTFATFDDKTITFENPTEILQILKGLTDQKTILASLKQTLPTNAQYACRSQTGYCKTLKPQSIGLIFDRNALKVHLFINPKFIEASKIKANALPASTASSSLITHNHIIYSKLVNTTYAFNTDTLGGFGNGYLSAKTFYTHQVSPTANETKDLIRFTQLAGQYYHNGDLYSAGVIPTGGNGMFTQTVSMIGAKYQNFFDAVMANSNNQGSPLIVFLPTPAQVEVYRAGELIYANDYAAGKHQLNTASFPMGSYDITIRITNSLRQVTEEQRFFVKRLNNIDINHTRYSVALGAIQKNDISIDRNAAIDVQLPEVSDQGVVSLDRDQLLSHQIDWNLNLLSNFERTFLSSELHYMGNNFTISPGVMTSNENQYGFGADLNFNKRPYSLQLEGARYYGTQRILTNNTSTSFLPISNSKYYVSVNGNYQMKQSRLGMYARWQKNVNQAYSQTITISYSHQLYRTQTTAFSINANLSKTQIDKIISIGINATFTSTYVDGQGLLAWKRDNIGSGRKQNSNLSSTANLSKRIQFSKGHTLAWNTGVDHDHVGTDYRAKLNYVSIPLRARASVLRNNNRSAQNNTNISAQIDSSLVLANGQFGVGYHNNRNAGVIVDVKSPLQGRTQVLANNRPIATIANNTATPIFLSPYQTYNITINPQGAGTQYKFDSKPKTVTLYRGNIQHLNWALERRYILFTQVVDTKGSPLPTLLLKQKSNYNTTDETGYIQADVPEGTKSLTFIGMHGESCNATIPPEAKPQDGIILLDEPLVCDLKEPKK